MAQRPGLFTQSSMLRQFPLDSSAHPFLSIQVGRLCSVDRPEEFLSEGLDLPKRLLQALTRPPESLGLLLADF
jgi:hypothetical protein